MDVQICESRTPVPNIIMYRAGSSMTAVSVGQSLQGQGPLGAEIIFVCILLGGVLGPCEPPSGLGVSWAS
jgi:hypothetical protein